MSARQLARTSHPPRARGFTIVELMVTVAIALFLLGGLFTVVQNVRAAYSNQNLLAQLQDGQRLAMVMMADVIQAGGYFPNPVNYTAADLIAGGPFQVGQAISGTHVNAATPDTIAVRYLTANADNVLNCHGTSNTSGGTLLYTNTFSVVGGQLMCDLGDVAGPLPLVNGVQNLQVVYGVKRNLALAGNDVDTYLTADQMTNADWGNLTSVTLTITFVNPLAGQPTTRTIQPPTLAFTRVVDIMNRTGAI